MTLKSSSKKNVNDPQESQNIPHPNAMKQGKKLQSTPAKEVKFAD